MVKIIEQSLLGCLLIDNDKIEKCILHIEPNDFEDYKNKTIYEAMLSNHSLHKDNDYVTVFDYLERHQSGVTLEYLLEVSNILPTAENIDTYINEIKEKSNKRKLINEFKYIYDNPTLTSDESNQRILKVIENMQHVDNHKTKMIYDGIDEYVDMLCDGKKEDTAHKTFFTNLDEKVAIQDGDMIIIAGQPGTGKSALMLNIAKHFAMQRKKGLVVTLEMTSNQLNNRMLSNITGIENRRIARRELSSHDIINLQKAKEDIKNMHINIDDTGNVKIENLISKCNKLKAKNELDYLVVDHIGLMSTLKRDLGKTAQVSLISNSLKQLALSLKIPVIVLSQFSRKMADGSTGKRREPQKEDLKNSGSLEEDANILLFLYSKHDNIEEFTDRFMILKIAKNRDGECCKLPIVFHANNMRFREVDYDTETQTSKELPLSCESIFE